jgi:ribA/ribD-fused uncharacterized protein
MARDVSVTDQFVFFWNGWPSQWFKCSFTIEGVSYNCCEQYMMAEKARVFGDDEILQAVLQSRSPRDQKALGRKVRNFDEGAWNEVCRGIVYSGNLAKFTQNTELFTELLATDPKTIVEASPHDHIWGIGLDQDDPRAQDPQQWQGTNWLGIALMQVRRTLLDQAAGMDARIDPQLQAQLRKRLQLQQGAKEKVL